MAKELPELKKLSTIIDLMKDHQVHTLVFKRLAPNDNSKNQIYLGGNYSALQVLPFGNVYTHKSREDSTRDRFKADLPFYWMDDAGELYNAPRAQLILYPKYPEVRMSGFLAGAEYAPSRYLASRDEGRVMLLGITDDRRIIGHVIGAGNPVSDELTAYDSDDVFSVVFSDQFDENTRHQLLTKLKEIHEMGWVDSCKLDKEGNAQPYKAPNGGGYTLEALLGVAPNGLNEPDYLGWEVKQHKSKLDNPLSGGAITLMTPEPTGGTYKDDGVIEFVKAFGYPDTKGREDRFNFGGVHKFGETQARTKLTLELVGYDPDTDKITDINGGVTLMAEDGTEAAIWHYSSLLEKWNRKHSQAVYVPSDKQNDGGIQYQYGHVVALGTGTDFGKFLKAMAVKSIYYDPGIKVENVSTKPKAKKRSQFRIKPALIPDLYDEMELVDLSLENKIQELRAVIEEAPFGSNDVASNNHPDPTDSSGVSEEAPLRSIGPDHNNPPELLDDAPLNIEDKSVILEVLNELSKPIYPDPSCRLSAANKLKPIESKLISWLAAKADMSIDTFLKSFAAAGGAMLAGSAIWGGFLEKIMEIISSL